MPHQYGIDINSLDKFIVNDSKVIALPEYKLERIDLRKDKTHSLEVEKGREATVFVEDGAVMIGQVLLAGQEIIALPSSSKNKISANEDSILYIFYGKASGDKYFEKSKPFDHRKKYWGDIQTIVSKDYAGKKIFVGKGQYASLEFHCRKLESYFIHSGKLLLRLRAGRGQDRFFEVQEGSAVTIPPGLMHQRGGLEDTVIIEISTKDEDADSFLVEDGQKHQMPRLRPDRDRDFGGQARGRRICFDIDGLLCTQREGDYENAEPIKPAIDLVNKFYDEGFKITVYTSRFMGRNKRDQRGAYQDGYEFTKKQLQSWGVKYHEFFMGKPPTDILVDDRALFFKPDWGLIEKEIRSKFEDGHAD